MSPDLFGIERPMSPANVMPDFRSITTLADELKRELRETAAIQRNPFHRDPATWLAKPKRLTLTDASKRLTWTTRAVWDYDAGRTYDNADQWLKARRTALGLNNDTNTTVEESA